MEQLNDMLVNAAEQGEYDTVVELLRNPKIDPKWEQSLALNMAARYGHAQCVRAIVGVSDPMADDLYAVKQAVAYGWLDCVEILWPHLTLTTEQTRGILNGLILGNASTVLFVLDHSGVEMDEQYFLTLFAQKHFRKHDDILAVGRHFDIINNPNILDYCARYNQRAGEIVGEIREQHWADQQKDVLIHSLGEIDLAPVKKKM